MPPPGSVFKVYIIDEVHMLSTSAFNALLKSLEEPPPNTVFILATTEVHKIPETVISRCQRHDFRSIDLATIEKSLDDIIASEGRKAESGVTRLVARYAEGSLRDSQSLLERIMAYSDDDGQQVTVEAARQILGVAGPAQVEKIWNAIREENASLALELLSEVFKSGVDTTRFLKEFVEAIRAEFQNSVSEKSNSASQVLELEQLLSLATRGADSALRSLFSEASLESLVVRLSLRKMREKVVSNSAAAPVSGRQVAREISIPKIAALESKLESVKADAEVSPKANVSAASNKPALVWETFLASNGITSQRILIEHLKRLAIETFTSGELVAVGPDFSIDYLQRADSLAKLQQELGNFSQETKWKISFSKQSGPTASIYEKERIASKEKQAQMQKSALDHPSVKSLQRAFPGSNVSKVSVRK